MYETEAASNENVLEQSKVAGDVEFYKKLSAKPITGPERRVFKNERRPNGEKFSRLDHIMVRHGKILSEALQTSNSQELMDKLVETVEGHEDLYRDQETNNLAYFKGDRNVVVIVRDQKVKPDETPPPPPFIITAYTLEGGHDAFERRKQSRGMQ